MAQPRNLQLDADTFNALVDQQTRVIQRPYPLPPLVVAGPVTSPTKPPAKTTTPTKTATPTKPTVQPKGGTTTTPTKTTTPTTPTKTAQNPTDTNGTVDPTLQTILGALGSDGTGGSSPVDPAYTTGATIPSVTPATATQSSGGGASTALLLLLFVGLLVGGYFIYEKYRAKLKTDVAAEQQGVKPHA